MTILSIAIKNIRKNLSFYSLYLFSVMLILTLFFAFKSFSMNEIILKKISEDGRVETMTSTISVFLMAFVLFYMSYSNNFFLRRRMNELGIYTLLGYRKSTILRLFILENIIICIGAFLLGVLLGAFTHKGIVTFVVHLLGLNIEQNKIPLFNIEAIQYSIIFVIVVVCILTISNWNFLRKKTVLSLVRLEKKREKKLKIRMLPSILGLLLIIFGDFFLINAMMKKESLWFTIGVVPMGIITMVCITLGTTLSIYSLLPYLCKVIQNKKQILYKPFTIVTIPKFIYRIRTNAKTLIMLSLLSAGTLGIFGVSVLTAYYPIASLERITPSAFEFRYNSQKELDQVIDIINHNGIHNYSLKTTEITKVKAKNSEQLPEEYSISQDKGREPGFEVMRYSDYIELLVTQGKENMNHTNHKLDKKSCILVKYRADTTYKDIGNTYELILNNNETINLQVTKTTLNNAIGFSNSVGTLIVSDEIIDKMNFDSVNILYICSINGSNLRRNKKVATDLDKVMQDNIYFQSAYLRSYEIIYENSSTFLLLGFLTVLFFIASGSILHFHNTSATMYDKDEYLILNKMGYNESKIKSIIRNQVRLIYIIPFIIGLVHALCGLVCYSSLLMDDVLGLGNQMILPATLSIVISALIYFIYYTVTKITCYKSILS